ncbi:MAG: hypothetical protein LBL94_05975 [Prevotellaceae bacterium]|nr:hypothetical protein [Prevotellaceae bacterium]
MKNLTAKIQTLKSIKNTGFLVFYNRPLCATFACGFAGASLHQATFRILPERRAMQIKITINDDCTGLRRRVLL